MPTKLSSLMLVAAFATLLSGIVAMPAVASRLTYPVALTHERQLDLGILAKLNHIRTSHHLVALTSNPQLAASSEQHSAEMATDRYFAHPSVSGTAFWKRIQGYYPAAGWQFWSVGENLLRSPRSINANEALKLWMASPEHRANILDPRWRQIGIASVHTGSGDRADLTFVTTDFGIRR